MSNQDPEYKGNAFPEAHQLGPNQTNDRPAAIPGLSVATGSRPSLRSGAVVKHSPTGGTPAEAETSSAPKLGIVHDPADSEMPEHKCFWCGQKTRSMFWACERCGPLKEQGYARARERGENDYSQVIGHVLDVLHENGVFPNKTSEPHNT